MPSSSTRTPRTARSTCRGCPPPRRLWPAPHQYDLSDAGLFPLLDVDHFVVGLRSYCAMLEEPPSADVLPQKRGTVGQIEPIAQESAAIQRQGGLDMATVIVAFGPSLTVTPVGSLESLRRPDEWWYRPD